MIMRFPTVQQFSNKYLSLICLIMIFLLNGCAQYRAKYTPPKTKEGMKCVNLCLASAQSCRTSCNDKKMVREIAYSVSKAINNQQNNFNSVYPFRNSSKDDCGCSTAYDQCYEGCGGNIAYICVANCQ